jgi:hypothetical protein
MRMVDCFTSCITTNSALLSPLNEIKIDNSPKRILTTKPITSYLPTFDYNAGIDCEYAANLQKVSLITGYSYHSLHSAVYLVETIMYRIIQNGNTTTV